ncbi:MAG: hypothetical protein AAFO57_05495 [Pseudomonadota bacterium]
MWKSLVAASIVALCAAPVAIAQDAPPERERVRGAERLGQIDRRLDRAERNGRWEQGTRADYAENRFDRFEDRVDRRENRRDEAVDFGRRDVIEDRLDRAEDKIDRRENRVDRRRRGQHGGGED